MHGHRDEVIEFAEKCKVIGDNYGTDKEDDRDMRSILSGNEDRRCRVYGDEAMKISVARNNKAMSVIRKGDTKNPVLLVKKDGEVLRYHGEAKELEDHVNDMVDSL